MEANSIEILEKEISKKICYAPCCKNIHWRHTKF